MIARPDIRDFPQLSADVLHPDCGSIDLDCVIQASLDSFSAGDPPGSISGRTDSAPPVVTIEPRTFVTGVDVQDNAFLVDVALIARLLKLPVGDVRRLMHDGQITSICEKGLDQHQGQLRLTFFHHNRRARVTVDTSGQILRAVSVQHESGCPEERV